MKYYLHIRNQDNNEITAVHGVPGNTVDEAILALIKQKGWERIGLTHDKIGTYALDPKQVPETTQGLREIRKLFALYTIEHHGIKKGIYEITQAGPPFVTWTDLLLPTYRLVDPFLGKKEYREKQKKKPALKPAPKTKNAKNTKRNPSTGKRK